jgi:hypothetical protein
LAERINIRSSDAKISQKTREEAVANGQKGESLMPNISDIVGMGIDDTNNLVFAWYADNTVSAGSSTVLTFKRKPAPYKLPSGKTPRDIVGMGIDGTNNLCFAWYRDGTVSAGSSTNLAAERPPERFVMPTGKTAADIVGMGIDGKNNLVFAWYRDGTVSAGSSRDLGSKRPPASYVLAAGKTPNDVIEMGIDGLALEKAPAVIAELIGNIKDKDVTGVIDVLKGANEVLKSLVFAWYRDGTVSAGTSRELAKARPGSPFTI